MQRSRFRQPDEVIARTSSAITNWVLGIGFLSLHATVFFVSLVALLFWNLYDAPDNLWSLDVFRRWGALLIFHAIAVGAGWLAWRLLRAEQRAIEQNTAAHANWSPATNVTSFPAQQNGNGWHHPMEPATRVDRAKATATQADDLARRFATTTVIWGRKMATDTRIAMHQARSKLGGKNGDHADRATDPTLTWPEPAQHRTEDQEFIARFGGVNGHAAPSTSPSTGPGMDATETGHEHGDLPHGQAAGFTKDAGWTWVEAAAASWLARRETSDGQPPQESESSSPPAGRASPPPAGDGAAPNPPT